MVDPTYIPKDKFLHEGDIIVVRSGAYTGDVGLITTQWNGAVAGYDLVISLNTKSMEPDFLVNFMLSATVQTHFEALRTRAAQPHLNSSQLKSLHIPCPPLPEQKKIAKILTTVDRRLELLQQKKERLQRIKRALMNDLLTGRRRVKIHPAEI